MLGLGNILTRGSNPVEPFTGAIVSRWPARGSGYGVTYLPDTVGTNHINTTLGQALDFDGSTDFIYSADSEMNFLDGKSACCLWFVGRIDSLAADGGLVGTSRTTFDCLLQALSTGSLKVWLGTGTVGSTATFVTAVGAVAINNTYSIIFSIDLAVGASSAVILIKNLTAGETAYTSYGLTVAGAALAGTMALNTTTRYRKFVVGVNAKADSSSTFTIYGAYFNGPVFCAGIGAFHDTTEVQAIIDGGAGAAYDWIGVRLDHGSTFSDANCAVGTQPPTGLVNPGTFDATSWLNGTHLAYIPQKGYGGGNYTGGVGVAALYSFDVGDDTEPGCGISTASMDTLGDTFTFEMWIYKVADDGADGMCFVSTVDDAVAAADSRGFMLRNGMVGRTQALTDLQLELHGATAEDYTAVVTLGATGWWYCAFSLSGGTATLYAVKATGSSFESIASAAVGSLTVVDAGGDNRLTIMHRVGSVAGQTQDNCLAGTRVDDLVYHAGVALTEAQLWERFIYLKSRYL